MQSTAILFAVVLAACLSRSQGGVRDCSEEAVEVMFSRCDKDNWNGKKIARDLSPAERDRLCRAQAFVLHCYEDTFAACPDSPTVQFVQAWMPSMEDTWKEFHTACPGIQ